MMKPNSNPDPADSKPQTQLLYYTAWGQGSHFTLPQEKHVFFTIGMWNILACWRAALTLKSHLSKWRGICTFKEMFQPLVGKFPMASIREQSQFIDAWCSWGPALLFYMWKMRKEPEPQHQGNDERLRSISKGMQTERSIQWGGEGGGEGGSKQRSSWEVFVAPGRRGSDAHERKPWLWISGHQDPVNTANPCGCWLNKPSVTKQCTVETVSASSRPICPHITHSAGSVARPPDRGSTASVPQLNEGWHSVVSKSTEFRNQDRIK